MEMFNTTTLQQHVSLLNTPIENLERYTDKTKYVPEKWKLFYFRGERCATKEDLFQEVAAVLQFPYYFGNNWDALDECIQDLEWINTAGYVLIFTNADLLLSNEKEQEYKNFLDIFIDAAKYWSDEKKLLKLFYRLTNQIPTKR